jgi:lysozyme
MIEDLVLDLIHDEGFRQHPYKDSVGVLTIGYGRNLEDVGIKAYEAKYLLTQDIRRAITESNAVFSWLQGCPDNVRRGLYNMVFNLGMPRLKGFKKMLAALEAGDYSKAADEALDSKWAKQVGRN